MADRDFGRNENRATMPAGTVPDDRPRTLEIERSGIERAEIFPRIPQECDDKGEHIIATYWG